MAKLTVKNVGPIREAEFEVKKHTVFIGPQGSGKSTLAKLIAVGGDHDTFKNENKESTWSKYSLNEWITVESEFLFSDNGFDISLKNKLSLTVREHKNQLYQSLRSDWLSAKKSLNEPVEHIFGEDRNSLYSNLETSELRLSTILEDLVPFASVYIPAERTLISILSENVWAFNSLQLNLSPLITLFGRKFESACYQIKELPIGFLSVSYKNSKGINQLTYNDSGTIPLSKSASGYQSIVPLILTVEYLRRSFIRRFIIEEPELNLYPTAQKDLIYNLMSGLDPNADYQDAEWVITTHSPYVLSSFNTLMLAYKVAQKSDELRAEVEKIIPARCWINPDEFAAYYVDNGTVRSIISEKTGLIADNELDDVSENLAGEQDQLLALYRSIPSA